MIISFTEQSHCSQGAATISAADHYFSFPRPLVCGAGCITNLSWTGTPQVISYVTYILLLRFILRDDFLL